MVRSVVPESQVCSARSRETCRFFAETTLSCVQALEWLESIKSYIQKNPQVKGFPEDDKAVYEL